MFLINKSFWEVKETKKKGFGVFAKKTIKTGTVIGDYVGKLIRLEEVDFDKEKENLYLMYYDDNHGIYPDLTKPGIHLLNHSCSPNCWITKFKDHTLVFALKNIKAGEELTISYLLPPRNICTDCTHHCFCKSKNCSGTMHLSESKYKKWQKFQQRKNHIYLSQKKPYLSPLTKYPHYVSGTQIETIYKFI
jgi:SET domain-containing protein